MNLLDLAVVTLAVAAAFAGHRLGLVTRLLSWAGLGSGVALAVLLLPATTRALAAGSPSVRLLGVTALLVGLGALGQAAGLAVGAVVRTTITVGPAARAADRAGGALVGALGVLVAVWMLLPAVASTPGWPARAVRDSAVARLVDRIAPEPPGTLATLGRVVGEAPFPEVLDRLQGPPDVGEPPAPALSAEVTSRVSASTVKVEGEACGLILEGSGFVVAPELVVTNAHVVAGEETTGVVTDAGRSHRAEVVGFDPARDVAVLRVPGLGLDPLEVADAEVGGVGAVFGHPGGGSLRIAPARVAQEIVAVGSDIYRRAQTRREVLVLAAALAPGDSGGPLVDQGGRVVGLTFAVDPAERATAYALTDDEVLAVLEGVAGGPVPTGGCLVG
ncbi:MAG: MarP family serine protease [Acidimicrobiia bacterium]|nr:MarP family serine protease [Acidimicrobiia bacterium]